MTCGIYSITSPSGNCYIGSSINIERRWKEHKRDIEKNRHHAFKLQKAADKYGFSKLVFQIVETCSEDRLLNIEQEYLDSHRPQYNSIHNAYSPMLDPGVLARARTPKARENARQWSFKLNRAANLRTPEAEAKREAIRTSAEYRNAAGKRSKDRNAVAKMHTPEVRAKMTATRRTPESRKISQDNVRHLMRAVRRIGFDENYESSWAAAKATGALQPTINKSARTGCKAGGHHWVFVKLDYVI